MDGHGGGAPSPERVGSWTRTRIGTEQQFRWLEWIVRSILVLNVIDAALTLYWVSTGRATEANPLLADLVRDAPITFVLIKTTLVALGSWLLWRRRKKPLAVIGIFSVFLAYYLVLLHHLHGMNLGLLRYLGVFGSS
jgi:hypothetical protein